MSTRKLNFNFLEKSYESFSFFMPKNFVNHNSWTLFKYNNWSFLDSFIYFNNLKQLLIYLRQFFQAKKNSNKKLLFIFDDDIFYFFDQSSLKKNCFFANGLKEGLNFTSNAIFSSKIGAVIYIGSLTKLSLEKFNQINYPILMITDKKQTIGDYTQYSSLDFHSSIFFIKLLLEELVIAK